MVQKNSLVVCALLLAVSAIVAPGHLQAQAAAQVAYLEGTAFLQPLAIDGSHSTQPAGEAPQRIYLEIGHELPATGLLVLSDNSLLEIELPAGRILLSRAGQYELEFLLRSSAASSTRELGSMVRTRVRGLSIDHSFPRTGVAAGVRGTEGDVSGAALSWASAEMADELVAEAMAYLHSGLYLTALETLEDAGTLGAEGPEFSFLLGYLSYLTNDLAEAYRQLSRVAPDPHSSYYQAHVLVLAQLHYDGLAYADAAALLQPVVELQLAAAEELEFEPLALLVLSLHAAGRVAEAEAYMSRVQESEHVAGREYAEMLQALAAAR